MPLHATFVRRLPLRMLAPSLCDGVPSHCISPVFAPSVCFGWANPFSTPLVILFLLAPASGSIAAFLPLRHLLSVCTSHTITPSIPPLPFSTAPSVTITPAVSPIIKTDALFDSLSLSPCCLDPFHRQKALATPSAASICPSVLPPLTLYCSSIPRGVGKSARSCGDDETYAPVLPPAPQPYIHHSYFPRNLCDSPPFPYSKPIYPLRVVQSDPMRFTPPARTLGSGVLSAPVLRCAAGTH